MLTKFDTSMVKNNIQEQRMKSYFLNAAKEIILGEGISAISARNVAEKAGYSYATLYNYFNGLKDLISISLQDFQNDLELHIHEQNKLSDPGIQKIKSTVNAYVNYFIQYPSLFNLFFIEKLGNSSLNHSTALFLDTLYQEDFEYCIGKKTFTKDKAEELKQNLRYTISGILLLYVNRNYPKDYRDLKQQLEIYLQNILAEAKI